jgi:hypothetical protein
MNDVLALWLARDECGPRPQKSVSLRCISSSHVGDMLTFEADERVADRETKSESGIDAVQFGNNRLFVLIAGDDNLRAPSAEECAERAGD